MTKKKIEFTVELIKQTADQLLIAGRCCEDVIQLGDVFERVYRYTPIETLEDYGRLRERVGIRQVSLRVEKIYAYGHYLEELHTGTTAELELSGIGSELLQRGDVLGLDIVK